MTEWRELADDVRAAWDTNAPFWTEFMGEDGNQFHRQLIVPSVDRLLDVQPGERVLEVACGAGSFSRRMAAQGADVVGFDVSSVFVDLARERNNGASNPAFHVIDATDEPAMLALGEGTFDAAVSNMALMDIPDIQPLLAALSRLLKPGGRFIFTTMHPCFNSNGAPHVAESPMSEDGEYTIIYSMKVSQYITPRAYKGTGVIGQPVPHLYFHRPFSVLFGLCFAAGFMLDGMEEPVFDDTATSRFPLTWANYREIPPVVAARMRLVPKP